MGGNAQKVKKKKRKTPTSKAVDDGRKRETDRQKDDGIKNCAQLKKKKETHTHTHTQKKTHTEANRFAFCAGRRLPELELAGVVKQKYIYTQKKTSSKSKMGSTRINHFPKYVRSPKSKKKERERERERRYRRSSNQPPSAPQ